MSGYNELPNNLDAEMGLLGGLLVNNRGLEDVAGILAPEHFYLAAHGRIYEAIVYMADHGRKASPVTLKQHFKDDVDLKSVGGAQYLADLAGEALNIGGAGDYAREIYDLYLRRQLIALSDSARTRAAAYELGQSAGDVLEQTETQLFELSEQGQEGGPAPLTAALDSALNLIDSAQKGERTAFKTGIGALDNKNGGFYPGQLITLAGRPSMGKTACALTMAHNMAQSGSGVLFFSMEMTREEIAQRLFSRYTNLATGHQLREGALKADDYRGLTDARARMQDLNLHIDESGQLTPGQIRARARRHKRRYGLDVIFIDYLNIMRMPDRYASKVDQIAELTAALKGVAKDLKVPVVLLAQLSREVEKRDNKRPALSDLRDSGAIEQDSDIVLMLYRDEYYKEREGEPQQRDKESDEAYDKRRGRYFEQLDKNKGVAEIIIGKWRMGTVGDVRCGFDGRRQLFYDLEGGR